MSPAIPPNRPPDTTSITPVSPKDRGEGGTSKPKPEPRQATSEDVEAWKEYVRSRVDAYEEEKAKSEVAEALDGQFVRDSYDVDSDFLNQSTWDLWKNPQFDSLKEGQSMLLTDIPNVSDIGEMEFAIAVKINDTIIVQELDKKSYSEIENDGKSKINDAKFKSSATYKKMVEAAGGFDAITAAFPGVEKVLEQITISADPSLDDALRDDGFITWGSAMTNSNTYTLYPAGMQASKESLERTIIHEMAHLYQDDNIYSFKRDLSMNWEEVQSRDAEISRKFADENGFTIYDIPQGKYHVPKTGSIGITDYGETQISEDWAESFLYYCISKQEGGIGTDDDGNVVTFEDLYPNRAKMINEWMQRWKKGNEGSDADVITDALTDAFTL